MTGSSSAATGTMKPTGNTDFVSLPAVVDRPIPTSLRADPLLRHHTGHNPGISLLQWRSGGSSIPTICRLTDSRRHQLFARARPIGRKLTRGTLA
jgi:hypothetical protein